jgi:hypothetical protein
MQAAKTLQSDCFRQAEISFSTVLFWEPAAFTLALPSLTHADTLE